MQQQGTSKHSVGVATLMKQVVTVLQKYLALSDNPMHSAALCRQVLDT